MEPGSIAERLVLSFPATATNYRKAIDQLKERFGREDLLEQICVRDLLTLAMKNAAAGRAKSDLPLLYDELESKLISLESLEKTQDKYGDFLTPLVESCLPDEVLVAWERNRNHQTESEGSRSLEQLMNFLRQEMKGEEMVLLARTGLTLHQNPRKRDYHATQVNKVETTTAAALVNMDNPGETEINLSIGADVLGKLLTGNSVELKSGVTAVETKLGWTVFGKDSCVKDNILTTLSMHSMNIPLNKLWKLEVLGISSPTEIEKQKTELFSLNDFNNKMKILPDRSEGWIVYKHCRVVLGVSSSPFLLNAFIMHLLENCQPQHEEVAQKLKCSFYVDNSASGVFNTDEQGRFIEHANLIMLNGCFNLRSFESNVAGKNVDRSSGGASVLGVIWKLETDTLKGCTNMDTLTCETKIRKRLILAILPNWL
ncbi:integrase catalytic domain-containing protein [Trichonephila clavipes]|nr:integrase catalytic domain-containing protein [Trichonephila clavipes]